MQDIVELERRIAAALDRIGHGLEGIAVPDIAVPAADDTARLTDALTEALAEEQMVNAQLNERVRVLKEREGQVQAAQSGLGAKIDKMTRQLDVQGLELQRMRKTVIQLRETLRLLREAATEGLSDPALVNRSLLAEAEALRATRQTELAMLDEILEELDPLIPETREDA